MGFIIRTDCYYFCRVQIEKSLSKAIFDAKKKTKYKVGTISLTSSFLDFLRIETTKTKEENPLDWSNLSPIRKAVETKDEVVQYLNHVMIPIKKIQSEKDLESFLFEEISGLLNRENVHRQYNVGGFLALRTDIDLFNGQIGIELKIAQNSSAQEMQRLIGQAVYYDRRVYLGKLIVLVVGKAEINATIAEMGRFLEELGVTFIYRKAISI